MGDLSIVFDCDPDVRRRLLIGVDVGEVLCAFPTLATWIVAGNDVLERFLSSHRVFSTAQIWCILVALNHVKVADSRFRYSFDLTIVTLLIPGVGPPA